MRVIGSGWIALLEEPCRPRAWLVRAVDDSFTVNVPSMGVENWVGDRPPAVCCNLELATITEYSQSRTVFDLVAERSRLLWFYIGKSASCSPLCSNRYVRLFLHVTSSSLLFPTTRPILEIVPKAPGISALRLCLLSAFAVAKRSGTLVEVGVQVLVSNLPEPASFPVWLAAQRQCRRRSAQTPSMCLRRRA